MILGGSAAIATMVFQAQFSRFAIVAHSSSKPTTSCRLTFSPEVRQYFSLGTGFSGISPMLNRTIARTFCLTGTVLACSYALAVKAEPIRIGDIAVPLTEARLLQPQDTLAQAAPVEEEIVITGTTEPDREPSTTPQYEIDRAEIEKQGANSVAEILKGQPGFAINDTGFGADIHTGTYYRGSSQNQSVFLLNGRSINTNVNTYHGNVDLNSLPVETIDKVELSSGGSSTLYGSEAFGGVVNIITKPGGTPKFTTGLQFGSYGQQNYRGGYQGSFGDVDYALGYEQYKAESDYRVPVGAANRGADGRLTNADIATSNLSFPSSAIA
jgi:vitamin B12 transporter